MASAISPKRRGDLAAALVAAGLDLLDRDGADAISLRAVARAAGVSAMAPYNHFEDRRALLAAIAAHGFDLLQTDKLARLAAAPTDPSARLAAGARAYVEFALARPALYRLMFSAALARRSDYPTLAQAAAAPAASLAALVGATGARDPSSAARAVWACCHGIALLAMDGHLPGDPPVLAAEAACRLTS